MQQKRLKILNKLGLHARAAAKLVSITNNYKSSVEVISPTKKANGKSIMSIMMLAAADGTELEIITNGDDELELITVIEKLILNKFDEAE